MSFIERLRRKLNLPEALEISDKVHEIKKTIRTVKGHDYANSDNVHLNFDSLSEICKILKVDVTTPYGCAMFYKLLKIQRECNLVFSNKEPKNESLLDTLIDGSNYDDLRLEIYVREGLVELD